MTDDKLRCAFCGKVRYFDFDSRTHTGVLYRQDEVDENLLRLLHLESGDMVCLCAQCAKTMLRGNTK